MSLTLSHFAASLREFIRSSASGEASATFEDLSLKLFRLQFDYNIPYRLFCYARRVTPTRIQDWTEIPAIPTSAFKDSVLSSLELEQRQRVFYSSGTTGQSRSQHWHSAESLALYEASLLPWFERHLLPAPVSHLQWLSLTPSASAAPNSSLAYMFDATRIHYGQPWSFFAGIVGADGSWTIDFAATIEFLRRAIQTATPVVLLGTAFNFAHLIDHCIAERIYLSLSPGSRVLETGGYKGRSRAIPKTELHELIAEHLGVPTTQIVTEYGMSELSSQAYDRVAGDSKPRIFQFPPWVRAQIISPETGEPVADGQTGLIRVFDLANVWSVMAIQTEDLAIAREGGFELLGRAESAEPRGCSLMTR